MYNNNLCISEMALETRLGVLEGINVSVDDFRPIPTSTSITSNTNNTIQAYFLTHAHSDHTRGLSSSFWKGHRPQDPLLYLSQASARIVNHLFSVPLSRMVILQPDQWNDIGSSLIKVYPTDAVHCVGSLVLLFKTPSTCILHTGDFRPNHTLMNNQELLNADIDILYLDDTYLDAKHTFPPRREVLTDICSFVGSLPNHRIFVAVDNLGKEELLVQLGNFLKTKVVVSKSRMAMLRAALGWTEAQAGRFFTLDPSEGRIEAVSRRRLTAPFIQAQSKTLNCPTVGICPSVWSCELTNKFVQEKVVMVFEEGNGEERKEEEEMAPVHYFPYSLHSSFNEIVDFVSAMQPAGIIPITSGGNEGIGKYFGEDMVFIQSHREKAPVPSDITTKPKTKRLELDNAIEIERFVSNPTNVLGGSSHAMLEYIRIQESL